MYRSQTDKIARIAAYLESGDTFNATVELGDIPGLTVVWHEEEAFVTVGSSTDSTHYRLSTKKDRPPQKGCCVVLHGYAMSPQPQPNGESHIFYSKKGNFQQATIHILTKLKEKAPVPQ